MRDDLEYKYELQISSDKQHKMTISGYFLVVNMTRCPMEQLNILQEKKYSDLLDLLVLTQHQTILP